MATTNENQDIINEIEKNVPILIEKTNDGYNGYKSFVENLKDEWFIEKGDEKEEDAIKRAESIYDRLDEMIKRNDLSNKKALETIEILTKTTDLFKNIVKSTEDVKESLAERNNELIDIIIDLEQRKTNKLIEQYPKRKHELKGGFEDKKEEWGVHRIKTKETLKKEEEIQREKAERLRRQQEEEKQKREQEIIGKEQEEKLKLQQSPQHHQNQPTKYYYSNPTHQKTQQNSSQPVTINLLDVPQQTQPTTFRQYKEQDKNLSHKIASFIGLSSPNEEPRKVFELKVEKYLGREVDGYKTYEKFGLSDEKILYVNLWKKEDCFDAFLFSNVFSYNNGYLINVLLGQVLDSKNSFKKWKESKTLGFDHETMLSETNINYVIPNKYFIPVIDQNVIVKIPLVLPYPSFIPQSSSGQYLVFYDFSKGPQPKHFIVVHRNSEIKEQ